MKAISYQMLLSEYLRSWTHKNYGWYTSFAKLRKMNDKQARFFEILNIDIVIWKSPISFHVYSYVLYS